MIDWGAVIVGVLALMGNIISNTISNSKTIYRIEQLEKKQDKHNSVIERVYHLEEQCSVQDEKLAEYGRRINMIERKCDDGK